MHILERLCIAIRHNVHLKQADWVWNRARVPYNLLAAKLGKNGLRRNINGTDVIRICPTNRDIPETYEPEVWAQVMNDVQCGDFVVDVGSYIGLYSIAIAKRVGPSGHVFALEPDPQSFTVLRKHCLLNGVSERVTPIRAAAGDVDSTVNFVTGRGSESHATQVPGIDSVPTTGLRLDTALANKRADIMKIDVEGYEEAVLRGCNELLQDPGRKPRSIYIEVHPYAWSSVGTTSDSLLSLLAHHGYEVWDLQGRLVTHIGSYGEIIARSRGHWRAHEVA